MANDINEMKSRKAKTPLEKVADSEKNIILITGIGGFLGFSLSKVLAQDYVVIGLDRESECSKYPDCVSCDLSSDRSVKKAMDELRTRVGNRFASVIHLSGYYDFTGEPNPLYEEVNVNGTHRLTMAWARIANAAVGLWLLFAPLVFWTPSAAAYLNDTLVGSLVIGFAILARPMPGIGLMASMTGPDIPPGWDYSPLSWTQRIPIIFLAFIGLYVSRYLAAYQLGHIGSAWDPYFGNGTETIITSDVSKAWPVPDAGLGAVTYILEILTGIIGGRNRWRTMPWLVILFGVMIVPLGPSAFSSSSFSLFCSEPGAHSACLLLWQCSSRFHILSMNWLPPASFWQNADAKANRFSWPSCAVTSWKVEAKWSQRVSRAHSGRSSRTCSVAGLASHGHWF